MSDKPTRLTKGQLVLCTSGAYSDFGVQGIYEVLEDMDVPYKITRFKGQPRTVDVQEFIKRSTVREVSYVELWQDD